MQCFYQMEHKKILHVRIWN